MYFHRFAGYHNIQECKVNGLWVEKDRKWEILVDLSTFLNTFFLNLVREEEYFCNNQDLTII